MDLKGKIVLVTGASSGIGKACAQAFARSGAHLVLCARNRVLLEDVAHKIREETGVTVYSGVVDVRDRAAVESFFHSLSPALTQSDILINNAGLAKGLDKLYEGQTEDWDEMIDTNIKGLLYFTRCAIPGMIERGGGHVINIGSIAGTAAYPNGAVYCATKAAVKMISDGLRMDIAEYPIRVTNIQPGMVETNFSVVRFEGDRQRAANVYQGIAPLTAEDIAEIAVFAASRPAHVQIGEITVTATHQASAMVVHRKRQDS